jgi:hypothetical protein
MLVEQQIPPDAGKLRALQGPFPERFVIENL